MRPNTRQQVNAFVKRMKWLSQQKELMAISEAITYGLERSFNLDLATQAGTISMETEVR